MIQLYRAVSFAEYQQLMQSGRFEIVGSSVEGKYFAESPAAAAEWGIRLFGAGNYRLVEVTMPAPVAAQFYRLERLDGIGPARFAEMWQLEGIELQIREVTP
jgi:hypothetical protein